MSSTWSSGSADKTILTLRFASLQVSSFTTDQQAAVRDAFQANIPDSTVCPSSALLPKSKEALLCQYKCCAHVKVRPESFLLFFTVVWHLIAACSTLTAPQKSSTTLHPAGHIGEHKVWQCDCGCLTCGVQAPRPGGNQQGSQRSGAESCDTCSHSSQWHYV